MLLELLTASLADGVRGWEMTFLEKLLYKVLYVAVACYAWQFVETGGQ